MSRTRWIPVLVWAGIILIATSVPGGRAQSVSGGDKLAHLAMYGVLGLLALRAVWATRPTLLSAGLTLAALAVFAAADEWHQQFIPSRSADPADWIADLAGSTLGVGAMAAYKLRRIHGT